MLEQLRDEPTKTEFFFLCRVPRNAAVFITDAGRFLGNQDELRLKLRGSVFHADGFRRLFATSEADQFLAIRFENQDSRLGRQCVCLVFTGNVICDGRRGGFNRRCGSVGALLEKCDSGKRKFLPVDIGSAAIGCF